MYFIKKEEDLIGKEIVFTYLQQACGGVMAIVTKDKGIFIFDWSFEMYDELAIKEYIVDEDDLADELNKLNIITDGEMAEYKKQIEEKRKREQEEYKKQQAKNEYTTYLKLKEKYEGVE